MEKETSSTQEVEIPLAKRERKHSSSKERVEVDMKNGLSTHEATSVNATSQSQQQLFVKDPQSLMDKESRSQINSQMSPMQILQMGFNPQQLQVLMHQYQQQQQQLAFQSDYSEASSRNKQLEHFLQMSILHQPEKPPSALDPLQLQHQQHLMSQFQRNVDMQNGLKRLCGNDQSGQLTNNSISEAIQDFPSSKANNNRPLQPQTPQKHPLYTRGVCSWAGCETSCETHATFISHLNREHVLNERSTAQTRVQAEIVSSLQQQLKRENDRLEAMRAHLDPSRPRNPQQPKEQEPSPPPVSLPVNTENELTGAAAVHKMAQLESNFLAQGLAATNGFQSFLGAKAAAAAAAFANLTHGQPLGQQPEQRSSRHNEEVKTGFRDEIPSSRSSSGGPTPTSVKEAAVRLVADRGSSVEATDNEISKNRDFYRSHDVRPPFTYAALIRQAIIESPDRQLTLNEIYTWFQNTFAFFRRNAATWKNAVRHNLSLHKCFMRVENVKGAVWTVDELEYHRRRPQRGTATNSGKNSPPFSGTASSFYGDSMIPHESTPIPPHIAGLSYEQQAYLHNLGNPYHLEQRRNSDDMPNMGLNNNTINAKPELNESPRASPRPTSGGSNLQPQTHHQQRYHVSPASSMHLDIENPPIPMNSSPTHEDNKLDDKPDHDQAEDLSNKASRNGSPSSLQTSNSRNHRYHPYAAHSELMIKSE